MIPVALLRDFSSLLVVFAEHFRVGKILIRYSLIREDSDEGIILDKLF